MKAIVLFDMDGTLTPPRKKINNDVTEALKSLQDFARIGIVSGSPYDYIQQQMGSAWSGDHTLEAQHLTIMPCNGTQLYTYSNEQNLFVQKSCTDMIDFLGFQKYRIMISILTDLQNQVIESYEDLPVSGNFISFRGSMVNWCMIGRDASDSMRQSFVNMDEGLRLKLQSMFKTELLDAGITGISSALGGSTSIDIYPCGWDKTYCLSHVPDDHVVYFVGDKCKGGGNDAELFESPRTISYETSGPSQTLKIIERIKRSIRHV